MTAKFRLFELTLKDGSKVTAKMQTKITEKYAYQVAYHVAKVNRLDVISIKGIQ